MNLLMNSGKVLYAQLGRDEMRFVVLGNTKEVQASHVMPTPPGAVVDGDIQNVEAVLGLLKRLVRRPEFKECRKIVFSLCTSQVITETVTVPDLPVKRLEKLLMANMDMYFPVDMTNYNLEWQIIGPMNRNGNREVQVQLWAVPKEMLVRYYELANACNLSVARIDYCGSSLASAVGASFAKPVKAKERVKLSLNMEISFGKKKEEPQAAAAEEAAQPRQVLDTELYLLLENDILGATFVQGGQVVLQRFISCGANPIYQFNELAMMVEFYRSTGAGRGSKISAYLTGVLVEDEKIVEELKYILGVPVEIFGESIEPRFVLCIGASRSNMEFGIPVLDEPHGGRGGENQMWQYGLMAASGLLLIGTVVLLLTSRLSWTSEINNLKNQQQTLLILVKQTAGFADKYDKYKSEYDKYSSDWDTIFNQLHTYNDNLVLAMEELEKTLPVNTDVVAMQIAQDGLTVQFACASKEEAAYLIMALREMKYMELVAISNLQGGGGGAATSYGPQNVELPPVDGSNNLSDRDIQILADLMMANMNQKQMMETMLNLSDAEISRLENVYGKKPTNKYSSLKSLRSAYAAQNIFQKRCDAVHELLTTNPFAVQIFVDLVKADMKADSPVLLQHIIVDLMKPENSDMQSAMMNGAMDKPEQALGYMERLVKILCKNETTLTATEDLFRNNSKMEKWYVYYLEMELGLQNKMSLAFLDMDKVVDDLMKGSFNTGDKTLDAKLNALIPQAVWTALEGMKDHVGTTKPTPKPENNPVPDDYPRADLMLMIKDYRTNGQIGDTYVNGLVAKYLESGKTGKSSWDTWMKQYEAFFKKTETAPQISKKPSDYAQDQLISMLFQYLTANSSGDAFLDELLDYYIIVGSTGDRNWDNWLKPYKNQLFGADQNVSGSPGQYPVYFVVSLKYKDELLKEELDRKGFDYEDKIEKVEVLG